MEHEMEIWVISNGIDVRGSFKGRRSKQAATASCMKPASAVLVGGGHRQIECGAPSANNSDQRWNVSSVMCGDGSSGLSQGSLYGSGSIDGSARSFWSIDWKSLSIAWKQNHGNEVISWPYKAVTRSARLSKRNGRAPLRLYVDLRGYGREVGLVIVKQLILDWIQNNPGYCILIGGPGARCRNEDLSKYFVLCFGKVPYQSVDSRDCMRNAMGNAMFLLLGGTRSAHLFSSVDRYINESSRRSMPLCDGKPEVRDLIKLGHLGLIFQSMGGDLGIRKVSVPKHGHREDSNVRFNWIFSSGFAGKTYIVRLYEANIVDHVLIIDRRCWPSLIYDSSDMFPIMLSSNSLFGCGGPDAKKVKVEELFEVFRHRRTGEKPKHVRHKILKLRRGY